MSHVTKRKGQTFTVHVYISIYHSNYWLAFTTNMNSYIEKQNSNTHIKTRQNIFTQIAHVKIGLILHSFFMLYVGYISLACFLGRLTQYADWSHDMRTRNKRSVCIIASCASIWACRVSHFGPNCQTTATIWSSLYLSIIYHQIKLKSFVHISV